MTISKIKAKDSEVQFFESNYEHLSNELRRLDLMIQVRVKMFREKVLAMHKGEPKSPMYISHSEIDSLLFQEEVIQDESVELKELRFQIESLDCELNSKVMASLSHGIYLTLPHLAEIFNLSTFEIQVVIICLAPELDRKYDKLYAYLQDDITRKKPSVDLVLNLLCESKIDRWKARTHLSRNSPLFRAGIVRMTSDLQSPSGSSDLARFLKLDSSILNFLLGENSINEYLTSTTRLFRPANSLEKVLVDHTIKQEMLNLIQFYFPDSKTANANKLILHLKGPPGVGKRDLALGICGELNYSMILIDLELLPEQNSEIETQLRLAYRDSLLLQAAVYIDNVDTSHHGEAKTKSILKILDRVMSEYGWLTFLSGENPLSIQGYFDQMIFHSIELHVPEVSLRIKAWETALSSLNRQVKSDIVGSLATQFHLTPGQIKSAAAFAKNINVMKDVQRQLTVIDLFSACRNESNQNLNELAVKIEPRYDWKDLVLAEEKLTQLNEICSQVKHQYRVFNEWGFDQKLAHGKGLSVLFSGPPGTGKTMAAEVIANELRLDLYKVDLSGVISKYIGETEKNLAKIFREAKTSNAILFFDEADALFGKRTVVSDSHDRYANIETSFLLQKIEEYEGVTILATNIRENIDDAFTRRIRFIVEFPFPDAVNRLRIWKKHFPMQAPLSEGIEFDFLSKQFKIAGGNIKNIVINSAFLAAENGKIIGMEHILAGTKREYEKIGKLWSENDYSIKGNSTK